MKFTNCIFWDCEIKANGKCKKDTIKNQSFYNKIIEVGNILEIRKGELYNTKISGEYKNFVFCPTYCKNVEFQEDFYFFDGTIKVNCLVMAGLNWDKLLNKFLAGLLLLNEEAEYFVNFNEIQEFKSIIKRKLNKMERRTKNASKIRKTKRINGNGLRL